MPANQEEVIVKLTLRGRQQFKAEAHATGAEIKHIGDETEKAGKKARLSSGGFGFLSGTFSTVEKWAKRAAFGVAGLAVTLGVVAYKAFTDSQAVSAQTAATIKSTGGVAGVTAQHVMALANSVEAYGGQTNAAIRATENLLLTFPKIRNFKGIGNDIYDQTTKAVVDMARALHQPLKNTAIQVGKALQDPIKGLLALRRVGVAFSPQEQKHIENLAKTGHLLQAQKEILKELNKEFGGSEAAFGKTGAGRVAHFKAVVTDLGVTAGRTFIPLIAGPISMVSGVLERLAKNTPSWGQTVQKFFSNIKAQIPLLMGAIRSGGNIGSVIDAMFGGTGKLIDPVNRLWAAGKNLVTIFRNDVLPILGTLAMIVWGAWLAFSNLDKPLGWVADHSKALRPVVWGLVAAWGAHGAILLVQIARTKTMAFWEAISTERMLLMAAAQGVWWVAITATTGALVAMDIAAAPIELLAAGLILLVAGLALGFVVLYMKVDWFRNGVNAAFRFVVRVAQGVFHFFQDHWQDIIGVLTLPFGGAVLIIANHFESIKDTFLAVINWVIRKWDDFADHFHFHIKGTNITASLPHISEIGGGGGSGKGVGANLTTGVTGAVGAFGSSAPRMHSGGTVQAGGAAVIRPDEEMVVLPTAARVLPLPATPTVSGRTVASEAGGSPEYLVVKLNGKVLLEATKREANGQAARV